MKNLVTTAAAIIVVLVSVCSIPSICTYVCFSLAEGSTNPELLYFIGICPWFFAVALGAIAVCNKEEKSH